MMDFAKKIGQAKLCDSLLAANPQLCKKFSLNPPRRHGGTVNSKEQEEQEL